MAQKDILSIPLARKSAKDCESVFMFESDMTIQKSEKLRDKGAKTKRIRLLKRRKVPLTGREVYYYGQMRTSHSTRGSKERLSGAFGPIHKSENHM